MDVTNFTPSEIRDEYAIYEHLTNFRNKAECFDPLDLSTQDIIDFYFEIAHKLKIGGI